jgi:hypothetical protein
MVACEVTFLFGHHPERTEWFRALQVKGDKQSFWELDVCVDEPAINPLRV